MGLRRTVLRGEERERGCVAHTVCEFCPSAPGRAGRRRLDWNPALLAKQRRRRLANPDPNVCLQFRQTWTFSAFLQQCHLIRTFAESNNPDRPQRWSIFQGDGMVNVFFLGTIAVNGFSMILTKLDHHH